MDKIEMEKFIKEMNDWIIRINRPNIKEELFPNIFIYGIPRSGTTLLSQILIHCLDIGYINNLIARFYKAPFIGAILTSLLNIPKSVSFKSYMGRTPLISDPHEFGYFWSNMLGYTSSRDMKIDECDSTKINIDQLKKEILALNSVFEKPCIFKNVLIGFFIKEISVYLKKSIFIYIERNLFDNAVSFLKARQAIYGDVKKWWSLKPKEWEKLKDKSPEEQVAGQVFYLRKEFEEKMKGVNNVIKLKYEHLCEKPMEEVEKIISFVYKITGYNIKLVNQVKPFIIERYDPKEFPAIKKAIDKYFSG